MLYIHDPHIEKSDGFVAKSGGNEIAGTGRACSDFVVTDRHPQRCREERNRNCKILLLPQDRISWWLIVWPSWGAREIVVRIGLLSGAVLPDR